MCIVSAALTCHAHRLAPYTAPPRPPPVRPQATSTSGPVQHNPTHLVHQTVVQRTLDLRPHVFQPDDAFGHHVLQPTAFAAVFVNDTGCVASRDSSRAILSLLEHERVARLEARELGKTDKKAVASQG